MKNHLTKEYLETLIIKAEYHRLTKSLTVCVLTLQNGFEVLGQSAVADPNNYNKEIGEKIAYENAFNKIWELEGYMLKTKLSATKKL
ncbi:Gp49 family protein [Phocoenobacter skyensis]|uniref:Gp49 family protein n=1 Tax=Phocoenobacter skyensis TaxID=97481 RepID=A0ABT9JN41_9PAST|nr:Gp49 family protein [Pasteurella skyensis]MDP8080238.1 Gp49 family protein [Pasteurella skyensis]MDP8086223.1 Gp49 family protein [Pasteurella skyensis]